MIGRRCDGQLLFDHGWEAGPVFVRTCTRRPLVCLPPSARRRAPRRGGPRWVHPFPQQPADRGGIGEPDGDDGPAGGGHDQVT
jgi:hypothetical protein